MDCVSFNKKIVSYLDRELNDEELNEFLHHLSLCEKCSEELEVNFLVQEGMKSMDLSNRKLNLVDMYREDVNENIRYIERRKLVMTAAGVVKTVCFWALAAGVIVFFREFL